MSPRILTPLGWSLWALLLIGLLVLGARALTERSSSPEAGRGLGAAVTVLVFTGVLALGGGFLWATRAGSTGAQLTLVLLMLYPIVLLIAGPMVKGVFAWRVGRDLARHGDFREPHARALAGAIARNDAAALRGLLATGPLPAARDRAGNDLLAWAVVSLCDGQGGLECLDLVLKAGRSARDATDAEGRPLILRILLSHYRVPRFQEAIALLLEHGADPDQLDAVSQRTTLHHAGAHPEIVRLLADRGADLERLDEYGQPPVVSFTSSRYWTSALELVERGVRLDHVTPSGISLNSIFADWSRGGYGPIPDQLATLQAAVERRRAVTSL